MGKRDATKYFKLNPMRGTYLIGANWMKPILSTYLFGFQQERQRMVNHSVKEGGKETESDFLWTGAVTSLSTAIYYLKLASVVTRKTEKHKDVISCHLLNSTKNKMQVAYIWKPQRPLLKVSLLVSLEQPVQVGHSSTRVSAVCSKCTLHFCDVGCYHQARSQMPPLHSCFLCDNKNLHLRCSDDGSCFVLCQS